MIDAQTFGAELAGIVKAATAPLIARIDALEKQVAAVSDRPDGLNAEQLADQLKGIEDRAKAHADEAMQKAIEAQPDDEPEIMTVDDIKTFIANEVAEAAKSIPAGKDGERGPVGEAGPQGDPGRDGLDVKDLFRGEGGRLLAVMSDGTTKDLGVFVGQNGKDGADGLGFDDVDLVNDDQGRAVAKFHRGDIVKTVTLPGIVDRGPYRPSEAYQKGDAVSYGGSLWIAQADTSEKPESGSGWRLAVKKGRDGKDGQMKAAK